MARESKPFRDRNPVIIGAVSLSRDRRAGAPRLQRAVPAADRRRHRLQGAVLRGRRPAGRRPGARRRRQGRQGREPRAGGRRGDGRVPGQGRLRRRPLRGGDQDRDGAGREVRGPGPARRGSRSTPTTASRWSGRPRPTTSSRRSPTCRRRCRTSTPPSWPRASRCCRETFSETPEEVRTSLEGLARLSDTIASRDAQLRQLLSATRKVTQVLADRNGEFTQLILRLQHPADRGAGTPRADRLDPAPAPRSSRRSCPGWWPTTARSSPRRCSSSPGSRTSCPATGRPWPRR